MKVQFSFYKHGYETEGGSQALVLYKNKQTIADKVFCNVPCYTKTRKTNPVFVVEAHGRIRERIVGKKLHIYIE
jgi:hypothetical protein